MALLCCIHLQVTMTMEVLLAVEGCLLFLAAMAYVIHLMKQVGGAGFICATRLHTLRPQVQCCTVL